MSAHMVGEYIFERLSVDFVFLLKIIFYCCKVGQGCFYHVVLLWDAQRYALVSLALHFCRLPLVL